MNEIWATWIFDVFKIIFFQSLHDTKDGDTPANKWDLFKNYFLEKLLLKSVLSALEKCVAFSGKPNWFPQYISPSCYCTEAAVHIFI